MSAWTWRESTPNHHTARICTRSAARLDLTIEVVRSRLRRHALGEGLKAPWRIVLFGSHHHGIFDDFRNLAQAKQHAEQVATALILTAAKALAGGG